MMERHEIRPWGAFGGEPGETFRVILNPGESGERPIRGKESLPLTTGDVVLVETSGGGGYGPPEEGNETPPSP